MDKAEKGNLVKFKGHPNYKIGVIVGDFRNSKGHFIEVRVNPEHIIDIAPSDILWCCKP